MIDPRAAAYRFTIVMIEPTVVVMRFDLGALVKLGSPANEQEIGTPLLNQGVEYGTHVAATGRLLWRSPDLDQGPPGHDERADRGSITAGDATLTFVHAGDGWVVARERRSGSSRVHGDRRERGARIPTQMLYLRRIRAGRSCTSVSRRTVAILDAGP